MDANTLPKGHIIGWTPPPAATKPGAALGSGTAPLSKNAKKRQKQREKKADTVKDNWDDEDEEEQGGKNAANATPARVQKSTSTSTASDVGKASTGTHTPERPNWAAAPDPKSDAGADGLSSELEKLEVR